MTRFAIRSAVTAIAAAAVCAVIVSGCGVPTDSEVRTIDAEDIPTVATTTSSQPEQSTSALGRPQVYLADTEGALVATSVQTEGTATDEVLQEVLDRLTVGPSATQTEQGLSSFVPPTLTMTVDSVDRGKALIGLGGDQLPSTNQTTATAQIVLSATSVPNVTSVQLTLNSDVVEAPLLDGALTTRALTAADYRSLIRPTPTG
jgi:spore germination protein GerM